jgi:3-phosphoshikimate 1-carboxyvinyltransferase
MNELMIDLASSVERVKPARAVHGVITVPGDKSISHRYAMLTSIAQGQSRILNYSTGADCRSTLSAMAAMGVKHEGGERDGRKELLVHGRGLNGLQEPRHMLDAGNSGSTIRMLSGILAAQSFACEIGGDESLSQRPMKRILAPLAQMGARIQAADGGYPPLRIQGSPLHGIDYSLPVASAQVKSCVLLAGLYAGGETVVRESVRTRDHTEIALRELGADIRSAGGSIHVTGGAPLSGRDLIVPGDLSSAAFFLVAALVVPEAELVITNVGLNPTRTALLDFLLASGASIKILNVEQVAGELIGTLQVRRSRIRGGVIEGPLAAALIDEIPVLAVLGATSEAGLVVKDAAELRVKETDRIATIAENLRRMGVAVDVAADGFTVPGKQSFQPAELDSFGDHRIAMAFSVAALAAGGECVIHNAGAASVSYPEFYATLRDIVQ